MRSRFFDRTLRLRRSPPTASSPSSPTNLKHPATPHPSYRRSNPVMTSNPDSLVVPSISIFPPTPTPTRPAFPQTRSSSSSVSTVTTTPISKTSIDSTRSAQSINSVLSQRRRAIGSARGRVLGSFEEDVEGIMEPRGPELEGDYVIAGIGEVLNGPL